jgi:hypothetical protein
MEVIKTPAYYETSYRSIDGKIWQTEQQCLQYEALLADPSPLKNLAFYNGEGAPIDIFALKEIPAFVYLLIKEESEVKYDPLVIKTLIGAIGSVDASYNLPILKGLWFNDWSNAYNGGYGFNGWERCDSIDSLQQQIASYQRRIELYKKILKGE